MQHIILARWQRRVVFNHLWYWRWVWCISGGLRGAKPKHPQCEQVPVREVFLHSKTGNFETFCRKQAQNDLTWNHLQYRQTVPFRIHNLPPFIFDFFDQNDGFYGRVLRDDKGTPFLYPRQLDFLKRSFETVGSSASQESLLSALKLHYRQFQSDVKENTLKRSHTNADFRKRQLNEQESKDIKRKIRELDLRETTGRQETQGGSKIVDGTKIIIGSSTSTKLNYILTEVFFTILCFSCIC